VVLVVAVLAHMLEAQQHPIKVIVVEIFLPVTQEPVVVVQEHKAQMALVVQQQVA